VKTKAVKNKVPVKNIKGKKNKQAQSNLQHYLKITAIILFLFLLDRITKILILKNAITFDGSFLSFVFVKNTGASFGVLKNFNVVLIVVALLVIALFMFYRKAIPFLPFTLILAGALGNVIDRIFFGYVVDFIDFKFWPVFNVADSCISIGIVMWIILLLKR